MTHITVLCVTLAAAFFLTYWQAGLERERLRRCSLCGSRAGEKHHPDCAWGKR
jgi:hypothetical protein